MLRREEKRGSQMQILTRSTTFESILQSSWERNDSRASGRRAATQRMAALLLSYRDIAMTQ